MERSSGKLQGSEKSKEQEDNSAGNKDEYGQPTRVTFNAGEITVVRRPGEGSRPLFDRDEILNHEQMSNEERRRYRHSFSQYDTGTGERRRAYDSHRTRSYHRERLRRERFVRRCPTCRRHTSCFSDDEEMYAAYYADRLYRTRSDEMMLLDHSYRCYHVEDPTYEVVGYLVFQPSYCSYFASWEY